MKCYLPILFYFLFSTQVFNQRFEINFVMDGRQRECIVYKPSKPAPVGGYPVVFMLHGTAQDGEQFSNISGWKELGEEENFITVFPTSLKWCFVDDSIEKFQTRWVNGNIIENPCLGPPQNYIDDVKFLKRLVIMINDSLSINLSKVFASGFSNGCSMIHKLAMDAGDVFAAVAGTSAPLSSSDSLSNPVKRIPIWFMLGNMDPGYIRPPLSELPFGEDSILLYLRTPLSRALTCQGLTDSFVKKETPFTHTYIFNESQAGMTSSPYLFTLIKDMIHIYPNGTNFPISAPKLFWEFFKQTTVGTTLSKSHQEEKLVVYPNPSNSQMIVQFKRNIGSYHYKVINSIGQTVFQEYDVQHADFILDKSKIGVGLFVLLIEYDSKRISKKILFN